MFRFMMSDGRGGMRVVTLPRWTLWAAGAGALALLLLFLTLSLTVLVVLAPVAVVAGLIARWRMKKALREAGVDPDKPFQPRPAPDGVIDVEYRVIDDRRPR